MKRYTALIMAALLLLCSCSGGGYADAREAALTAKSYALDITNVTKVVLDGEENVYEEIVHYAQANGVVYANRNFEGEYNEYYDKDGTIYNISEAGEYSWPAKSGEVYKEFCFATPLDCQPEKGEKGEDGRAYTISLNGNDYTETLLAINPLFEDFEIDGAVFDSFTYTATVDGGKVVAFTYDFTFEAKSGDNTATITNTLTATYADTRDLTMPEGYESFVQVAGNIGDISEEAFTQEVMLIIVEALYNGDGTRKDNFDEVYDEFVQMYGEETMSTFIGGIEEFNESLGIMN